MNRRRFIKSATGALLVPATSGIVAASVLPHRRSHFRTSAFTELTPTGGLFVYDASQESYSNGASVSQLTDRYGAGVNVVQATGANQPVFVTNVQNSLPAVQFNGSSHLLATASAYANSLSAITVWAVFQTSDSFAAVISNQIGWTFGQGWGIYNDFPSFYGRVTKDSSGSGGSGASIAMSSSWQIVMLKYDGTTITVKRNKNAASATASLSGSIPSGTSFLTLGSYATGGYHMSGYIGEVAGYNWAFDATTEVSMWTRLSDKWGITLTP